MVGIYTPPRRCQEKIGTPVRIEAPRRYCRRASLRWNRNKTGLELRRRAGLKSRRRRHSIIPPTPELFPTGVGKSALNKKYSHRPRSVSVREVREVRKVHGSYPFRTFRTFRRRMNTRVYLPAVFSTAGRIDGGRTQPSGLDQAVE